MSTQSQKEDIADQSYEELENIVSDYKHMKASQGVQAESSEFR